MEENRAFVAFADEEATNHNLVKDENGTILKDLLRKE